MSKKPSLVVFLRHGESEANFYLNQIARGEIFSFPRDFLNLSDWDIKLTKEGKRQAYLTGKYLKENFGSFDVCFSSPQKRALDTFYNLIEAYPLKEKEKMIENLKIDSRLREKDYGAISYLTNEEIKKFFPYEYDRREKEGELLYRPLGGESWYDVKDLRVSSFLNMIYREYPFKKILIVSHFITINCVKLKLVKDYQNDFNKIFQEEPLKNCGICVFENKNNKLILKEWNRIVY